MSTFCWCTHVATRASATKRRASAFHAFSDVASDWSSAAHTSGEAALRHSDADWASCSSKSGVTGAGLPPRVASHTAACCPSSPVRTQIAAAMCMHLLDHCRTSARLRARACAAAVARKALRLRAAAERTACRRCSSSCTVARGSMHAGGLPGALAGAGVATPPVSEHRKDELHTATRCVAVRTATHTAAAACALCARLRGRMRHDNRKIFFLLATEAEGSPDQLS